jgi:hypothetical protein
MGSYPSPEGETFEEVGIEPLSEATTSVQGLAQKRGVACSYGVEAGRQRTEQLRIEDPDQYKRILGLATDEGQRLAGDRRQHAEPLTRHH